MTLKKLIKTRSLIRMLFCQFFVRNILFIFLSFYLILYLWFFCLFFISYPCYSPTYSISYHWNLVSKFTFGCGFKLHRLNYDIERGFISNVQMYPKLVSGVILRNRRCSITVIKCSQFRLLLLFGLQYIQPKLFGPIYCTCILYRLVIWNLILHYVTLFLSQAWLRSRRRRFLDFLDFLDFQFLTVCNWWEK
jgi:hypothetical protein